MRFVLAFGFLFVSALHVGSSVTAQTGEDPKTPVAYSAPPYAQLIQKRRRGSSEKPVVDPRLQAKVFAAQIGDISAMALDADGVIYAADQARGRIIRLVDRARDGRMDLRRVIISGLEQPSGIAIIGERLFIADARAVWETSLNGGKLVQVASLEHSKALSYPRLLWPSDEGGALFLAITQMSPEPVGKIVSIDIETGQARPVATGQGAVTALAGGENDRIWAGIGHAAVPVRGGNFVLSEGVEFGEDTEINGLALPGQFQSPDAILGPWKDHIFVARNGKRTAQTNARSAVNVLAVPTRFGQPSGNPDIFMEGFMDRSGRTAWGQPGAILIDERGMFIADRWSGSIWLINEAPPVPAKPAGAEVTNRPETTQTNPLPKPEIRPSGSSILVGSKIEYGTGIKSGSSIRKESEPGPVKETTDTEK